jgi:hypothetical protein
MRPAQMLMWLVPLSLAASVALGAGCTAPAAPRDRTAPYVDPLDDHAGRSPGEATVSSASGLRKDL